MDFREFFIYVHKDFALPEFREDRDKRHGIRDERVKVQRGHVGRDARSNEQVFGKISDLTYALDDILHHPPRRFRLAPLHTALELLRLEERNIEKIPELMAHLGS